MEPGHRRPHRAAAVVGLLAGLVILFGAVLDGGLATPSRHDVRDPAAAEPSTAATGARPSETREDRGPWDDLLPVPPAPMVGWTLLAAAAVATLAALPATGPRHRSPALATARHRGPPAH